MKAFTTLTLFLIGGGQDLWNLGRVTGLPYFVPRKGDPDDPDIVAADMAKALRAASTKDRKNQPLQEELLTGAITVSAPIPTSSYAATILEQFGLIREGFAGAVIRRTATSLDNMNQPISGLPAYLEHTLLLTPKDFEKDNMEELVMNVTEHGRGISRVSNP